MNLKKMGSLFMDIPEVQQENEGSQSDESEDDVINNDSSNAAYNKNINITKLMKYIE